MVANLGASQACTQVFEADPADKVKVDLLHNAKDYLAGLCNHGLLALRDTMDMGILVLVADSLEGLGIQFLELIPHKEAASSSEFQGKGVRHSKDMVAADDTDDLRSSQTFGRRNYIHDAVDGSAQELLDNDSLHYIARHKVALGLRLDMLPDGVEDIVAGLAQIEVEVPLRGRHAEVVVFYHQKRRFG